MNICKNELGLASSNVINYDMMKDKLDTSSIVVVRIVFKNDSVYVKKKKKR